MEDKLKQRFGALVAAHRKKQNLTQQELADAATPPLSLNMIGRIETGKTGASFGTISSLARALNIDEAELFSAAIPKGALENPRLSAITVRLAGLSETDLKWIEKLIDTALDRK